MYISTGSIIKYLHTEEKLYAIFLLTKNNGLLSVIFKNCFLDTKKLIYLSW